MMRSVTPRGSRRTSGAPITPRSATPTPHTSGPSTTRPAYSIEQEEARVRQVEEVSRATKAQHKINAEKREWIETNMKLRHRSHLLEKEVRSQFYNTRTSELRPDAQMLEDAERREAMAREAEGKELTSAIRRIKESVNRMRILVRNRQTNDNSYFEQLQTVVEGIESDLVMFKERQKERYEALSTEERVLAKEIALLSKRFDNWDHEATCPQSQPSPSIHTSQKRIPASGMRSSTPSRSIFIALVPGAESPSGISIPSEEANRLHEEVRVHTEKLTRFLDRNGGTTGGWDERDHAHFLRLRTQMCGSGGVVAGGVSEHPLAMAFFQRAATEIPDQDLASVQHHEDFYVEYLTLLENKRQAIQRWKAKREQEKKEALARAEQQKQEEEIKSLSVNERELEEEMRRREEEKRRIAEWRAQKEEERRKKLEEEERIKAEKERRRREELERKREMDKERLREYQKQKEMKKREEELRKWNERNGGRPRTPLSARSTGSASSTFSDYNHQHQHQHDPAATQEVLRRLRERDATLIQKQKELVARKKREQEEREHRQRQLAEQVQQEFNNRVAQRGVDPFERLTSATVASSARETEIKLTEPGSAANNNFDVRHLQRKAVPAWRQGVQ